MTGHSPSDHRYPVTPSRPVVRSANQFLTGTGSPTIHRPTLRTIGPSAPSHHPGQAIPGKRPSQPIPQRHTPSHQPTRPCTRRPPHPTPTMHDRPPGVDPPPPPVGAHGRNSRTGSVRCGDLLRGACSRTPLVMGLETEAKGRYQSPLAPPAWHQPLAPAQPCRRRGSWPTLELPQKCQRVPRYALSGKPHAIPSFPPPASTTGPRSTPRPEGGEPSVSVPLTG